MKFSQRYFPPQELVKDGEKMRIRLGSYIQSISSTLKIGNVGLAIKIRQNVGLILYQNLYGNYDFEKLFSDEDIKSLLDVITEVYKLIDNFSVQQEFFKFVNLCFVEEGLAYRIEEDGSVIYVPDEEFESNKMLTLKCLTDDICAPALEAFNRAYHEFQADIEKSKSALRYIFEANEILFKKFGKPKYNFTRLNSKNIDSIKNYILDDIIGHIDKTAHEASEQLIESYKNWVNGMHSYRHGQDVSNYDNPPLDLAILALSNGASYLRWIASLIQIKLQKHVEE